MRDTSMRALGSDIVSAIVVALHLVAFSGVIVVSGFSSTEGSAVPASAPAPAPATRVSESPDVDGGADTAEPTGDTTVFSTSNVRTGRVFHPRILSTTNTCKTHSREYHKLDRVPGGGAST